jgi:phenylpropionate dioxygenase-like ring-hydroxylating dioxygenase large terminal subunit
MNAELERSLVRRVLAHLEHRTTDADPAPSTLPVAAYRDDRDAFLFGQLPLAVGHASQVASVGDFFTHDASGLPLLVVRHDDGIHAFLNVCRHRGTRLEAAPCGQGAKAFVCPYHAWSYGRDGAQLGAPHAHGFAGLGPRDLSRVPIAEIAGLLIIRPRPDWLGPLGGELASYGLASGHAFAPRAVTRALSWQLAVDVFLETYHLRTTHRDSIYPMFFDTVGLVDRVGPHLRNVFPKRSIRELAAQPEADWALRRHANVLYHLFPNTFVLVEPDHAAVLHVWPQGPDHTLLTSYMVVPEAPATDKARAYWHANNDILMTAVDEDFAMGESIQRGLASGANAEVVFGSFEHALEHFHRQVREIS